MEFYSGVYSYGPKYGPRIGYSGNDTFSYAIEVS